LLIRSDHLGSNAVRPLFAARQRGALAAGRLPPDCVLLRKSGNYTNLVGGRLCRAIGQSGHALGKTTGRNQGFLTPNSAL
ncbi:hypothetical protein, partial [Pseudomonas sp. NPDC007930]|uniref:hypothetical protein n=1 Tax=Pseudomonas sp. NPDC007930 TaxID=3364417 RepID=UPI0036E37FB4